jgi:hypothetical protein
MGIMVIEGMCVYYHLLILETKHWIASYWYSKESASITTY